MTTPRDDDHHRHAHLDGGACLDGSGRTWKPGEQSGPFSGPAVRVPIPRGLGPGHDRDRCSVCRGNSAERRRALVDEALIIAVVALVLLLVSAWFLSP